MNQEVKTIVKKTAKIAGVTCLALGSAALITSGAALKALTEGAKYLKDSIQKIVDEKYEAETVVEENATEENAAEETVAEEAAETAELVEEVAVSGAEA